MSQQTATTGEPDIEQAAIELWRQTKNDSLDWDWGRVIETRKEAYRRIAMAVLSAAGAVNGLRRGGQ